ncbi:hypothetical protein EST38_g8676 [Candolleomyces aberdarensis]|uniref:Uncharacterized protein n=1 Tax=Candolleomyces aberdarensis TaxID=2316362 RepID=A0A4Q2DE60_9AGAR|nr:hypothetical protein EST38_g8676 [Candolleomyces aberdarensis]
MSAHLVDNDFNAAYTKATEEGKADTTSTPGCTVSSTLPLNLNVVTEQRNENSVLLGSKVIERKEGERTLEINLTHSDSAQEGSAPALVSYTAHYNFD